MERKQHEPFGWLKSAPLLISLLYVGFGSLWILFSDYVVHVLFSQSIQDLVWFGTLKGLFFVLITGVMLYFLIASHQKRIVATNESLESTVAQRTQELATTNEELSALNEEILASNDQLQAAFTTISKQSDTIFKQKDEQLNRVLDNSLDAIFSIDLTDKGEHYLSRSCAIIFGRDVNKHVTDKDFWMEHTHPDDRNIRAEGRDALARDGNAEILTRVRFDEGYYRWVFERHHLVFEDGKPVRQEGIASDVTALKLTEFQLQSEKKILRSLIDHLPDYIYVKDTYLNHVLNNAANVALLGFDSEEKTLGKTTVDYFGAIGESYMNDDRQVIQSGEAIINKEEIISNSDGERRILLTTKVPLRDENGVVTGLVGISRDVTEYRRQESLLDDYRENLDVIFSNTKENILLLDHEGRVIQFNKQLEETITYMIGRPPKRGEFIWEITTPERRQVSKDLVERVARGEQVIVDAHVPGSHGKIILEARYTPVRINGDVKYIIVLSTDVTEKRRQEEALRAYQQKLDIIFSNTVEEILLLDHEGKVLQFNKSLERFITRATKKKPIVGEYVWELTVPERAYAAQALFARAVAGESICIDAPMEIDGENIIHQVRYNPVWEGQQVRFVTITSIDVTDRREQEKLLQESENNLRAIFDNSGELFALFDLDGRLKAFNSAFARNRLEYDGVKLKVGESIFSSVSNQGDDDLRAALTRVAAGETVKYQYNYSTKNEPKWYQVTITGVKSGDGAIDGFCLSAVDVTEINNAQASLQASEERFRSLVENSDDIFAIVDAEFKGKYVSPNIQRVLGYTPTELIGSSIADTIHPDDRDQVRADVSSASAMEDGAHYHMLRRVMHKDGRWIWMEGMAVNLYNTPGIEGRVVILRDVTLAKQSEMQVLELKDSLADFQNAIYRSSIVSRADRSGNITFVNENFVKISGYQPSELIGQNHRIINSNHHPHAFWIDMWRTISKGQIWRKEVKNRAKDGTYYWVDTFIMPFLDDRGHVREYLSIRNDITERKNAEDRIIQLNFSLADFKNAIHKSSIVSIADRHGNITYVNDNFVQISGYTEQELLGQNHRIINSGNHPKEFWVNMWKTIASGKIWREEVMNRAKDGTYYWVDTFIMPFLDESGKAREFLSIRNDITQRKKTEEELKRKDYFLAKSNEVAHIGYFTVDPKTLEGYWSDEVCRIYQIEPGTFDGSMDTFMSFTHPDDRGMVFQAITDALKGGTYDIDHRLLLNDGSIRWVHHMAEVTFDADGNPELVIGITQDITTRKTTEEVLKEYNERFEIVSKATNDAIWDWDILHNIETWNHGFFKIFGYSEQEIYDPKKWWKDKVHPDDFQKVEETMESAFKANRTNWSASYRYRCTDGTYKPVLDRAYVIYAGGRAVRMIGAMQDMTEQQLADDEIKKLSMVASSTNNAVIISDPDGTIEWVNQAFTDLTEYTLDEVRGKIPGHLLQGPETNKDAVARIRKRLEKKVPVSDEILNYSKSGRKYWIRLTITPIFNDRKELTHFISVQANITEQKEYESRITAIARELTSLIENASVPIFGIDRNGYINEWNNVTAEISEYMRNEVLGRKWVELMDIRLKDQINDVLMRVNKGEPVRNLELPFLSKSGRDLIFLVTVSPRWDVNRNIVGALCVAQDLTELILYRQGLERMVEERTRELNIALQKEKDLVEMKSKFVSIASHEFRTPLTTISISSGFLKKYRERMQPVEIDTKLETIEKQVSHMTYLLDDVLMIGKAEAGKINVQVHQVDLRDLMVRIIEEISQSTNRTHAIRFDWSCKSSHYNTDEKLMRNILVNLLNNAVKFSPGADVVEVVAMATNSWLRIKVKDYGIGVPEEDREKLFDSFHRGSNVSTIQGTGLGLSIVKKAVELLGGFVQVKSEIGEGTEFLVSLPIR